MTECAFLLDVMNSLERARLQLLSSRTFFLVQGDLNHVILQIWKQGGTTYDFV